MYAKYLRKEVIHVYVYPCNYRDPACFAGYWNRAVGSCLLGISSLCKQAGFLSGKGLPGEVEEIGARTLGAADEFVHYFSIEV